MITEGWALPATRRMAVVAVLLVALGLAACGSDNGDGGGDHADDAVTSVASSEDERQVMATIEKTRRVLSEGDAAGFCQSLSSRALEALQQEGDRAMSCERMLGGSFMDNVTEDLGFDVEAVRVDGDTATATARARGESAVQRAAFVKEGGDWKVLGWFSD